MGKLYLKLLLVCCIVVSAEMGFCGNERYNSVLNTYKQNQKESNSTKSFCMYDKKGRRTAICKKDKNGNIEIYDTKGRYIKTIKNKPQRVISQPQKQNRTQKRALDNLF